jgi:Putative lactococcus lactis phage r1t holin
MSIPHPHVPVDGTIWTKEFWVAAAERAIRTAAISAALVLIGDAFESLQVNAFAIDWWRLLGFALGGAILSLLLSVGANAKHGQGPSIGPAERVQRPPRRALPEPEPEPEEKT